MDTTTMIVIIGIVALLALFFYNRSRPAPRGTYDDEHARSTGSIGGGNRAYDDPAHRSSGSIGGGTRAYDTPEQSSSGSIGNRNSATERERRLEHEHAVDRNAHNGDEDAEIVRLRTQKAKHDDERFRSKGTIGG